MADKTETARAAKVSASCKNSFFHKCEIKLFTKIIIREIEAGTISKMGVASCSSPSAKP